MNLLFDATDVVVVVVEKISTKMFITQILYIPPPHFPLEKILKNRRLYYSYFSIMHSIGLAFVCK